MATDDDANREPSRNQTMPLSLHHLPPPVMLEKTPDLQCVAICFGPVRGAAQWQNPASEQQLSAKFCPRPPRPWRSACGTEKAPTPWLDPMGGLIADPAATRLALLAP